MLVSFSAEAPPLDFFLRVVQHRKNGSHPGADLVPGAEELPPVDATEAWESYHGFYREIMPEMMTELFQVSELV